MKKDKKPQELNKFMINIFMHMLNHAINENLQLQSGLKISTVQCTLYGCHKIDAWLKNHVAMQFERLTSY